MMEYQGGLGNLLLIQKGPAASALVTLRSPKSCATHSGTIRVPFLETFRYASPVKSSIPDPVNLTPTGRSATDQGQGAAEQPGGHLRHRVEALGTALADRLSGVVGALPGRPSGPRAVGIAVNQTIVTASRLLKALGQNDPIAVLQLLPGPNPLRNLIKEARKAGTDKSLCASALETVEAFDKLIREEAGDRGSLKAMLSAWLPEARREFEAQRRQTIFKALTELDGVSCDFEMSSLLIHPSSSDGGKLDVVNAKCLLGIDRIRPDAKVKLGTRRLGVEENAQSPERLPLNLDGEPAIDGLHTVRLDGFCDAPPAPFIGHNFGPNVVYELGPTGFGKQSKVDLVIAEWNKAELDGTAPSLVRTPHFFIIPEMATRKMVFDLFVHKDVFIGARPELLSYETSAMGPARARDPRREIDKRPILEDLQVLSSAGNGARLLEFPQYGSLVRHITDRLDWDLDTFRLFRVAVTYPLVGRQITIAFQPPEQEHAP